MSSSFIKINNSKKSAIKTGNWSDPGAKLYDNLLDAFDSRWNVNGRNVFPDDEVAKTWNYWPDFLKEAYLIAPVKDIKNSPYGRTPFSRSGCKYPHHIIRNGELLISIPGLKAAYNRACQEGIMKGEVKDHLERHIKELGIEASFHDGKLSWNESALYNEEDEKYFDEKSHGSLKYEYRIGVDVNTGRLTAIQFKLDPSKILAVGNQTSYDTSYILNSIRPNPEKDEKLRKIYDKIDELRSQGKNKEADDIEKKLNDTFIKKTADARNNALDFMKKNIKKLGHIDYVSDESIVDKIFYKDGGSIQSVEIVPTLSNQLYDFLEYIEDKYENIDYFLVKSPYSYGRGSDNYTYSYERLFSNHDMKEIFVDYCKERNIHGEKYEVGKSAGKNKYRSTKLLWDSMWMYKKYTKSPVIRGQLNPYKITKNFDTYNGLNKPKREKFAEANERIEANFNDIYRCILENTGINLFDDYLDEYLQEASHGKLKYDFRKGYDVKTGNMILLVYSLDNIKINYPGHAYKIGGPVQNIDYEHDFHNHMDYLRSKNDVMKNIHIKGNIDHSSSGQKLLAIKDLVTGKQLKEVDYIGIFRANSSRVGDDIYKNKLSEDDLNITLASNKPIHIKVGDIETDPTFKSTKLIEDPNVMGNAELKYKYNRGHKIDTEVLPGIHKNPSRREALILRDEFIDKLIVYNIDRCIKKVDSWNEGSFETVDNNLPLWKRDIIAGKMLVNPKYHQSAKMYKITSSSIQKFIDKYKNDIDKLNKLIAIQKHLKNQGYNESIELDNLQSMDNYSNNYLIEHNENALEGDAGLTMTSRIFDETGKTPSSICNWIIQNIEYDKISDNEWKLKSPGELYYHTKGNCHDQSLFSASLLHSLGFITGQLFFIEYKENSNVGGMTHTLTWYIDKEINKGKYYWIETAWDKCKGIHGPFDNIEALKANVYQKWKHQFNNNGFDDIQFSTDSNFRYGMSLNEYVQSWHFKDYDIRLTSSEDIHSDHFLNWILALDEWSDITKNTFPFDRYENGHKENVIFGYYDGNKLNGIIRMVEHDDYYELNALFVNEKVHNKGIGSKLIRTILKYYGHKDIEVDVFEDNSRAIHLYDKFGFYKKFEVTIDENNVDPGCEHLIGRTWYGMIRSSNKDVIKESLDWIEKFVNDESFRESTNIFTSGDFDQYKLTDEEFNAIINRDLLDEPITEYGTDIPDSKKDNSEKREEASKNKSKEEFVPIYGIVKCYSKSKLRNDGTEKDQGELNSVKFHKIIKKLTRGDNYSHALVSFDDSLTSMYSYEDEGFCIDNILEKDSWMGTESIYICVMFVNKSDKEMMRKYVKNLAEHADESRYASANLLKAFVGTPYKIDKRFVCSSFTGYIMSCANPKNLHRDYSRLRPEDITILPRAFYVTNVKDREDFIKHRKDIQSKVKDIYNEYHDEIEDYNNHLPKLMLQDRVDKLKTIDKIFDWIIDRM